MACGRRRSGLAYVACSRTYVASGWAYVASGFSRTICALTLACLTGAGCVASGAQGLSDHLIRPGEPNVVVPLPGGDPAGGLTLSEEQRRDIAQAIEERGRNPRAELPTLEGVDGRLRAALADVNAAPTAINRRRVAAEYRRVRIFDKAFEYLTQVLDDRKDADAYAERAQVWRDWGWPGFGLGDAYRAADLAPRSPKALNTLGTLLQAVGATAAARDAYRRAVDADPDAAYALNNLCYLSLVEGDEPRAVTECEAALAIDPVLDAARHNLARARAAFAQGYGGPRPRGQAGRDVEREP